MRRSNEFTRVRNQCNLVLLNAYEHVDMFVGIIHSFVLSVSGLAMLKFIVIYRFTQVNELKKMGNNFRSIVLFFIRI